MLAAHYLGASHGYSQRPACGAPLLHPSPLGGPAPGAPHRCRRRHRHHRHGRRHGCCRHGCCRHAPATPGAWRWGHPTDGCLRATRSGSPHAVSTGPPTTRARATTPPRNPRPLAPPNGTLREGGRRPRGVVWPMPSPPTPSPPPPPRACYTRRWRQRQCVLWCVGQSVGKTRGEWGEGRGGDAKEKTAAAAGREEQWNKQKTARNDRNRGG